MQSPPPRTTERTALVVGADAELAVALREQLDRAYLTVRDVRGGEEPAAFRQCVPWPWMLVGSGPGVEATVAAAVATLPVLVLWHGRPPATLAVAARSFERFAALVDAAQRALGNEVAGLRLAIGCGVHHRDGWYSRSAELEALVAQHPHGFRLPLGRFSGARRVLARRRVGWFPAAAADGAVRLQEFAPKPPARASR